VSWAWIANVRGGGALAPIATAFARRELGEKDAPPGPAALLALAGAIDRFATRTSPPAEESAFVEGAGAFLGVVLVAHLGGAHVARDGVHRVRLGTAGFFDPFAAIESALETEPAKAALVDSVAEAEREARGEGAIARVGIALQRALAELRDELSITDRFDRRVWVGDVEVDLSRAIAATEGESAAAVDAAVRKLVAMLPGGAGAEITREEAEVRVFPRVVGATFDLPVLSRPIAGDLRVAWVLAFEGRARFVTERDRERWSMPVDAIADRAIRNLAARSDRARLARVDTDRGPFVVARSGDGHDSARILLPALAETLAPDLGSPCLVAIPHRDALIACADEPEIGRVLAGRAAEDHARAPHGISARVFRLSGAGRLEAAQ
jgi:uncharacterized protein YtpQ (UPF0354 family)